MGSIFIKQVYIFELRISHYGRNNSLTDTINIDRKKSNYYQNQYVQENVILSTINHLNNCRY